MRFQAGEVIVQSTPFAAALDTEFLERACSRCLTCKSKLTRCAGCGLVHYCSDKCQKRDAVDHRIECEALRRVSPWVPVSEVRLLCRTWARVRRENESPYEESVLGRTRTFATLMTHRESRTPQFIQKIIDEIGSQVNRFLSKRDQPDEESLLSIFMKLDINSHQVTSWDGPIGCAIYLGGSIVDHSCAPDHRITYYFDGCHFVIRAMEDLEIDGPDCIRISYVPFILPHEIRRRQLKERYFFDCTCRRCLGDEVVVNEGSAKLVEQAQKLRTLSDTKLKLSQMKDFLASPSVKQLADNDYAKLLVMVGLFSLYGTLGMYADAVDVGEQLRRVYETMDVAPVHHLYLICQMFSAALNAGWFERRNPNFARFQSLLTKAYLGSQTIFTSSHYHSRLIESIYISFENTSTT